MLTHSQYRPQEIIEELRSAKGFQPSIFVDAADHIETMLKIIRKLDLAHQMAEQVISELQSKLDPNHGRLY